MPTNEERREVARRLRKAVGTEFYGDYVIEAIGCADSSDPYKRLADLIDPESTVDRDALLDIARQMEWASEASYEGVGVVSGGIVGAWAEKIKEACGVNDE